MSDSKITLKFDGPAVENGEIDVKDLAPPLLAIAELIQQSNRIINGEKAEIAVKVTATREGCFEIDLNLMQSIIEVAQNLIDFASVHETKIAAANELVALIFKITAGVATAGGGLFALLKWLRGKKPEKIERVGGDVHFHFNGNVFVANEQLVQLAENKEIREHAKTAVSTLNSEGISKFSVNVSEDQVIEITPDEVKYFDLPVAEDEELKDEVREMTLQIISLSFKQDNKWRVTDGAEPFSVSIEDADFLKKVANDELSFSKHDYLECEVRERQFLNNGALKKEISIIKVLEHKPSAKQLKLV